MNKAEIETVTIKRWRWLESKLNELIKAINALRKMTTLNPSGGKLTVSDGNCILDLGLSGEWRSFTDCAGNTFEVYSRNFKPASEDE